MPFGGSSVRNTIPNPFIGVGRELVKEQSNPLNLGLKVLDYLARPGSAVSGFALGLAKGDLGRAQKNALKGITGRKHFSFSRVLKELGVPKFGTGIELPFFGEATGRGVAGFALDVLMDPLSYVGLLGVTRSGRRLNRVLEASEGGQAEAVATLADEFGKIANTKREVLFGKANQRLDRSLRRVRKYANDPTRFDSATGQFLDPRLERAASGGREANLVVKKGVDRKGVERFRVDVNPKVRERIRAQRLSFVSNAFEKDALPAIQKRFQAAVTFSESGIKFRGKPLEGIRPEVAKELEDIVGAARILDEVTKFNVDKADILRNLADNSGKLLGETRAAAARKGFRSTITFGGAPVLQIAGRALGIPAAKLLEWDSLVFRGLDNALGAMADWPAIRSVRRAFTEKKGSAVIDEFLSKLRGEQHAFIRQSVLNTLEITEKQLIAQKKNPEQVREILDKTIDALERGNSANILEPDMLLSPEVEDLANTIRKHLDNEFHARQASAAKLNMKIDYLDGYFPRELTPEVKELFRDALDDSPVQHGLLLTAERSRGRFNDLTTTQINELFRENLLGIRGLQKSLEKNPKLLKRLRQIDPETASFFVDDPAQAIASRLAAGARVTSNRDFVGRALKLFGRQTTSKAVERGPHEVFVTPVGLFRALDPGEFNAKKVKKAIKEVLGVPPNMENKILDHIRIAYNALSEKELLSADARALAGENLGASSKLFTELGFTDAHMMAVMNDLGVPFYIADSKVVELINDVWNIRRDPATYNLALQGYDAVTNLWKRFTLSPFPEFHSRNFISDVFWQNHIAGINPVKESITRNGAYRLARDLLAGQGLLGGPRAILRASKRLQGSGVSVKLQDGTTVAGDDILREFINGGGFGGLLRDVEFSEQTGFFALRNQLKDFFAEGKEKAKLALNPLKPTFPLVQLGQRGGDFLQTWARLGHYIAKRKAGYGPDQAIMSMKKYLFDYSELTNVERNIMRRVFPFYTWLRKNIPLQLETLLKQPGKFANLQKSILLLEDEKAKKKIPEGGVPDFIRKEFGILTREVDRNTFEFQLLGSFIPAADIVKIGGVDDIFRLASKSINPIAQTAAESYLNTNFFSGLDIEKFPGEKGLFIGQAFDKKTINALRKVRLLNTIDRFMKEDPNNPFRRKRFTTGEKVTQLATGLRPIQVDPQRILKRKIFTSRLLATRLRSALKRAKKSGQQPLIDYLNDLLQEARTLEDR